MTVCPQVVGVQFALDPAFMMVMTQQWNQVNGFAVATNGQIYVSGTFDYVNGVRRHNLVRLNPDGSVDLSFNLKADSGQLVAWVVGDRGKLLVSDARFRWVDPDGTLEDRPGVWVSCVNGSQDVEDVRLLADGRLMVGGSFCYAGDPFNTLSTGGLIRLNREGTLDPSFLGPATQLFSRTEFAPLPDGRSLMAAPLADIVARQQLVRLNVNGSIDRGFRSEVNQGVLAILPDADGTSWIGGSFELTNHLQYQNLVRLNPDGTLDTSVPPLNPNGVIEHLVREAQDSFIASGIFTSIGGVTRPVLSPVARTNSSARSAWPNFDLSLGR